MLDKSRTYHVKVTVGRRSLAALTGRRLSAIAKPLTFQNKGSGLSEECAIAVGGGVALVLEALCKYMNPMSDPDATLLPDALVQFVPAETKVEGLEDPGIEVDTNASERIDPFDIYLDGTNR